MLFITVSVSVRNSFFGLSTLMMILMCYALAGVALFGSVKWGEGINRYDKLVFVHCCSQNLCKVSFSSHN